MTRAAIVISSNETFNWFRKAHRVGVVAAALPVESYFPEDVFKIASDVSDLSFAVASPQVISTALSRPVSWDDVLVFGAGSLIGVYSGSKTAETLLSMIIDPSVAARIAGERVDAIERLVRRAHSKRRAAPDSKIAAALDPYKELGLPRTASADDVRRAQRTLASGYHPDRVEHLGVKLRAVANRETKRINDAATSILQQMKTRERQL